MSTNSEKSWNRPWSIQEIIDNAGNWSLAGDAGLLKYLETFSENLLSTANQTNNNLNKLVESLDTASLSLDIVKNDFSSLHNTQFIENRVYEDDETLPAEEQSHEKVEEKKPSEEEKIKDMKEAVMRGINVVEKYFEKVEVPASDTEDETDFPSFVLRPKDPYIERSLPYVIGTEDWYKKWHVGLLDSSSDSEVDKISEKFSDSDSENDLPVQDRTQAKGISDSGFEGDMSNRIHIKKPVANSTFDESVKQPDIFGSSDSDEYNSVPVQAPISTRNFAQELAAKLGNVIEQNTQIIEPEVNRRPIQNLTPARTIGNLFSDEPPPIDEEEDGLFGSSKAQGMFYGGSGLFDDLDDDGGVNLWKDSKPVKTGKEYEAPRSKPSNLFDNEDGSIFDATVAETGSPKKTQKIMAKKTAEGLFDDDDDNDLFQESSPKIGPNNPYLRSLNKTNVPYFDDEPPVFVPKLENDVKSKKPVGGIKVFGSTNLFEQQKVGDLLKNRRQDSSESSDNDNIKNSTDPSPRNNNKSKDLFKEFYDSNTNKQQINKTSKDTTTKDVVTEKEDSFNKPIIKPEKKPKQLSLFDDDDNDDNDLFEKGLYSDISSKKFASNLFDKNASESDLFATPILSKSLMTNKNMFTSSCELPPTAVTNEAATYKVSHDEISGADVVFETSGQVQKDNVKVKSLFDDDDDAEADVFSADLLSRSSQSFPVTSENLQSTGQANAIESHDVSVSNTIQNTAKYVGRDSHVNTQSATNIHFFDQNPPELDDEWDTKSETNLFEENDVGLFDNTLEISSRRSNLFDNEPPSLFSESSGIVRDGSTRAETDDSFNPYASSSRRFSTDIFNEQQSNDSFFVTKNKSHFDSHNIQPNLDQIPETSNGQITVTGQSNLEITPSGNVDDFLSDFTVSSNGPDIFEPDKIVSNGSENSQNANIKGPVLQDSSEDYDLFSDENFIVEKSNKSKDLSSIEKYSKKLFDDLNLPDVKDSNLFEDKKITEKDVLTLAEDKAKQDEQTATEKPEILKIKPVVAKTYAKIALEEESVVVNTTQNDTEDTKIGSPGKLKHNLIINVNALMPGVSLPRKKDMGKSHSFEVASLHEHRDMQISVKSDPDLSCKIAEEKQEYCKSIEKSVSFENALDTPEVLHSITKDRVRITAKRRPPTRKARHQSIRNSVPDFNIISSDSKEVESAREKEFDKPEKPEDIEKGIQIIECENLSNEIKISKLEDILGESENDLFSSKIINLTENDISKLDCTTTKRDIQGDRNKNLFLPSLPDLLCENQNSKINTEISGNINEYAAPKIDNIQEQLKPSIFGGQRRSVINSDSFESVDFNKSDLFDDSEDFDDIFSSKKLPPKSNILKKSLFADELDDDDDDIFGPPLTTNTTATKTIVSGGSKATGKKQIKTVQVRKLENSKAVEDPLSSFLDG